MTRPNPHIALIYHYDLARALNGEPVDWTAIPVNVDAGREGGDLCRAAADFGKRRDLFAMPAPTVVTPGNNLPPIGTANKVAVPAPPVAVEQPATDPEPDTASPPVPGRAADRDKLIARIKGLLNIAPNVEKYLRTRWPEGVPTLKHQGHTPEQLEQILAIVREFESDAGIGWHPDDSPPPQSHTAARRAIAAWGDDINGCWFAASLIATFEQCRLPDCTLDGLVGQFSIEQCERLWEAAPR